MYKHKVTSSKGRGQQGSLQKVEMTEQRDEEEREMKEERGVSGDINQQQLFPAH